MFWRKESCKLCVVQWLYRMYLISGICHKWQLLESKSLPGPSSGFPRHWNLVPKADAQLVSKLGHHRRTAEGRKNGSCLSLGTSQIYNLPTGKHSTPGDWKFMLRTLRGPSSTEQSRVSFSGMQQCQRGETCPRSDLHRQCLQSQE